MKLVEQIDGYVETDVQTRDGRLRLNIDRSKSQIRGIPNHPTSSDLLPEVETFVYVVHVGIVITSIDKPLNEILKNLYRMLPSEFLSATQTTVETPGLYMNLKSHQSIFYEMPDTVDMMDLNNVVTSHMTGIYDLRFYMDEYEHDLERVFGGTSITITTDILQWYNNVKTSIQQIQPHIKRLNLTKVRTFFIIDPALPLHKKSFQYNVFGLGSPFKTKEEEETYEEFLSAIVSDYGVTVNLFINHNFSNNA